MQYKIEQIAGIIKAERHGNTGADISWLLTDSRSLCFPEETLFFAIKTKRNDGHRYISELYKNGVRNFVVSELPDDMPNCTDANFLVVATRYRHSSNWPNTIECVSTYRSSP